MNTVKLIESVIRAIMCLVGIVGNTWLGIRSLPSKKSQLRTGDTLSVNLAIANLITNTLVDMPDTMADFANGWFLGKFYCKVFQFCADLSETSSILITLLTCVFWHQKLVGSLKRGGSPVAMDSMRLISLLLAATWTVALVFSIPHFIYTTMEDNNETSGCTDEFPSPRAKEVYEIIYLSLANAMPVAGILFFSFQIVYTLLRHHKRIQSMSNTLEHTTPQADRADDAQHGAAARGPAKSTTHPDAQVRAAKSVVAVVTVFLVCWVTHLLLRISSNVKESQSSELVEVASYIAASYTSIIPYIFLHGLRKLSCSCRG